MIDNRVINRKKITDWIALGLIYPIAFVIRRSSSLWIRWVLWKFAEKYINWRGLTTIAKVEDKINILCNTRDLIQRYLIYFGIWEPHITNFVKMRLKQGGVFIDIGANIGYYSLITSKFCANVVAVEASPEIFYKLINNIKNNSISNIRSINIAVGNFVGKTSIYVATDKNIGATTLFPERFSYDKDKIVEVIVDVAPFDKILLPRDWEEARLIKIDIEGAEYYVLKNILKNIDICRKDMEILVEISPDDIGKFDTTAESIIQEFYNKGYFAYIIQNSYDVDDYINHVHCSRPKRLTSVPVNQVDIIFSRIDAEYL